MNDEEDKGVKAVAKDIFIGDNVPLTPRVSQPNQAKPAVAGITVTTGALRVNAVSVHGGSVINSIRIGTSKSKHFAF